MKLLVTKGNTNKTELIFIQDSSSTTGAGLTGIVAANLTAYYIRVEDDNDVNAVVITLSDLTGTGTVHTDGGLEEINSTTVPGWYRLDLPDALFATGASSVGVSLIDAGANDVGQITIEYQLTDVDVYDAVRGGMTALPNAAAEAAGGLYTRGTGAGQINQNANGQVDTNTVTIIGTAPSLTTGDLDVNVVTMAANSIAAGTIASGELTNIEDEIWDALKSAHVVANSFGDFLDIEVSGRSTFAIGEDVNVASMDAGSIASGVIAAAELTNIENEIWDALKSAHVVANSFGDFLDIEVSSRSTFAIGEDVNVASMDANSIAAGTIASGELTNIEDEIWDALKSAHVVANSFGDFLDIEISGRSTFAVGQDVNVASMDANSIASGTIASGELTNIENEIWDAAMSAHITADTIGLAANVLRANVAAAGAAGTITLDGSASTTVDLFKDAVISLVNGTGAGQTRTITAYSSGRVASIEPNWVTNPASGTEYVIRGGGNQNLLVATQTSIDAIETDTASLNDTKILQTMNLTAAGNIGIDWANVENPSTAVDLAGTDVQLCDTITTYTNDTPQTGDNFARIGAAGASLTDLGGMSTGMKAEVNVEAKDVINVDTITLPGQEAPPLAPTLLQAVTWLYKAFRNRKDQTSSLWQLYADDESTVDSKATVTDDATTAVKQEIVTGP